MSNYLAVATVTAALHRLLEATAGADAGRDRVPRPETSTNGTSLRSSTSTSTRSTPTRPSATATCRPGRPCRLLQRPVAALDLHYLFTFNGADKELEPQRLLGSVIRTLHAQPFLTPS